MDFTEAVEQVEQTEQFQTWKKDHPTWTLAHGFLQPEESPDWQLGYTDGERIITVLTEPTRILPEQEVYKQPDKKIEPLPSEAVTLTLSQAQELFSTVHQEKYSQEKIFKHIILVQSIDGVPLYNITGVTQTFKALNVRIGMDGKVLSDFLDALVQQS